MIEGMTIFVAEVYCDVIIESTIIIEFQQFCHGVKPRMDGSKAFHVENCDGAEKLIIRGLHAVRG